MSVYNRMVCVYECVDLCKIVSILVFLVNFVILLILKIIKDFSGICFEFIVMVYVLIGRY